MKIELSNRENPQIESDGEKYEKLNDKAKTALKAETEKIFFKSGEPEKNI